VDDEGRPTQWWSRLIFPLFQPRLLNVLEWRLGLAVIGLALLFAFLIFGTFIPGLIGDLLLGLFNAVVWVASLFSGSGTNEAATPIVTPGPTLGPSPSPSPSPLPSPLPQ
jgi:small-conductance mechanosensitive channel